MSASSLFNLPVCLISCCIFLFIDIIINSIVQGIFGPIVLQTILLSLQLFSIICIIMLKLILISQTIYLKMGSWLRVLKMSVGFLSVTVLHFLTVIGMAIFRMYYICRYVPMTVAWNEPGYYILYFAQQFGLIF